jgi:reductive dehalogenase
MNRRDFLRNSAVAGVAAGAAVTMQAANPTKASAAIGLKHHDSIDDIVKISPDYKRFPQKHTAFNLSLWTAPNPLTAKYFKAGQTAKFTPFPTSADLPDPIAQKKIQAFVMRSLMGFKAVSEEDGKKPGYTQLDFALSGGARAVLMGSGSIFSDACSSDSGPYLPMPLPNGQVKRVPMTLYAPERPGPHFKVAKSKHKFESKENASYIVKKAAKLYGADLVGIAPYDERWVYETDVYAPINIATQQLDYEGFNPERKIEFGFKPKSVIVMAIEMDYESFKTSPSMITHAAVGVGYTQQMAVSFSLAYFLRDLGYNALHSGNCRGPSVPSAIAAGLGEGSRMGMIITEEFGPRVRLCKVYTDMELAYDRPKTFGVKEFCEVCMKCADNCPSKAISRVPKTTDPENKPLNRCNNPGVDKWYNDGQKCITFWTDNYKGCSNCVAVCPYNKIDEWHHDLAKIATQVPGIRGLARYMDEAFGYGEINPSKFSKDYWKKSI